MDDANKKIKEITSHLKFLKSVPRLFDSDYKINQTIEESPFFIKPEDFVMNQVLKRKWIKQEK